MTSPGSGQAGGSRVPSRVGLTECSQLSSSLLPQHPRGGGGRASFPFHGEGKLRRELTGPRSHSPGGPNNRLGPATEAGCAHAPAHSRASPGPLVASEPRVKRGADGRFPHARPARPLRSRERRPARRTLGSVPEPAAGGRGRTGRRQGDPRLRSPRIARLLLVPPLPNFLPRSSPAADLLVRRALGALSRGCGGAGPRSRGHLPGSALPSVLARGGLGHVASRTTRPPGRAPRQALPAASFARRLAGTHLKRGRTGHREGQPLAQGHTARRREAGACRRRSPAARVPRHRVVLTAGLALELPHLLGRRVGSAHGAPRGPGRPTEAGGLPGLR